MIEFVIQVIVAAIFRVLFVEGHNINDGLWILSLLLLGDTTGLQSLLPFFRQALEEHCERDRNNIGTTDPRRGENRRIELTVNSPVSWS